MKGLTLLSVFYESYIPIARSIRVYFSKRQVILFRMKLSYKGLHNNIFGKAKGFSSPKKK